MLLAFEACLRSARAYSTSCPSDKVEVQGRTGFIYTYEGKHAWDVCQSAGP